jgi:hypothetical protein
MASLNFSAVDAVIGGTSVTAGAQNVPLKDSVTGATGDGKYTIALTSAGTYTVSKGGVLIDSSTQTVVAEAVVVSGTAYIVDKRQRQVSADAAAATLAHQPYSDGSYLQTGVVTARAANALTYVSTLNGESGAVQLVNDDGTVAIIPSGQRIILRTAGGGGGGGGGGGTTASLNAQQTATPNITHLWRCHDAAGSSTLVDSVGSTALAVGSACTVGVPGLLNDGATAVFLPGNASANSYLRATGVLPSSGAMCVEILLALYHTQMTVGVMVALGGPSGSGGVSLNFRPSETEFSNYGADTTFLDFYPNNTYPILYHLELDGSGNGYWSVNGILVWSGSIGVSTLSTQTLRIGIYQDDASVPATQVVQNIAVYSARLTTAQKQANMSAVYRR